MSTSSWTVSIVSHGHGRRVLRTLSCLHRQLAGYPHRLILTLNIPEDEGFLGAASPSLRAHLTVRRNARAQGFAANHNAALATADSTFVVVADPCLHLPDPIFGPLENQLRQPSTGIASPQAFASDGRREDNGRALVTPISLLRHYLLRDDRRPQPDAPATQAVDWLAGLFLAMRRETFETLHGFDERYFMYCEDVDLSLRTRQLGLSVTLLTGSSLVHDANRDTRRKWRYFLWHVRSLLRLWRSEPYRWAQSHRRNP